MSISSRLRRPGILAASLTAFFAVMFGGAQVASSSPGQVAPVAPSGVTLSYSGDSKVYHLAGASWFGGNFTDTQSDFTETEFLRNPGSLRRPRGQRLRPHALHDERER